MKTTIAFTLDTEKDKDILRWLKQQSNRSAAIRAAIRARLDQGEVTLGDLYRELQTLRREMKNRAFVLQAPTANAELWPEEPAEAAAALDRLGEL